MSNTNVPKRVTQQDRLLSILNDIKQMDELGEKSLPAYKALHKKICRSIDLENKQLYKGYMSISKGRSILQLQYEEKKRGTQSNPFFDLVKDRLK